MEWRDSSNHLLDQPNMEQSPKSWISCWTDFFILFLTQVNHFINSLRNKQLGQRPEAQNNHFVKVRNRKKQHFRRSQEQKKEGLVKSSESRSPETPRDQGVVARAKERRAAPMPVNV
jgi:hypothetical protein